MTSNKQEKIKRENDLQFIKLNEQFNELVNHLIKWANLVGFGAFNLEQIEKTFRSFADKLFDANEMLENPDLKENFQEFETYFIATYSCQDEFQTFSAIFQNLNEQYEQERKERKEKELSETNNVSYEELIHLKDLVCLNRFSKHVQLYYTSLQTIFDALSTYADELYVHHTGDITFCGTATPLN